MSTMNKDYEEIAREIVEGAMSNFAMTPKMLVERIAETLESVAKERDEEIAKLKEENKRLIILEPHYYREAEIANTLRLRLERMEKILKEALKDDEFGDHSSGCWQQKARKELGIEKALEGEKE